MVLAGGAAQGACRAACEAGMSAAVAPDLLGFAATVRRLRTAKDHNAMIRIRAEVTGWPRP